MAQSPEDRPELRPEDDQEAWDLELEDQRWRERLKLKPLPIKYP